MAPEAIHNAIENITRAERDLGTRLDWVAVDHWNTEHPAGPGSFAPLRLRLAAKTIAYDHGRRLCGELLPCAQEIVPFASDHLTGQAYGCARRGGRRAPAGDILC